LRVLWRHAPTTLVGYPCLVVLLANHRGLGSERVSGFERRLLVFLASAVCRHTLAGIERVTTQRSLGVSKRRGRHLLPRPAKGRAGNSASERRRREGENACNATIPHKVCGVSFELAHPPLPHLTVESANRRMHRSHGVDAFFVFFQIQPSTVFFRSAGHADFRIFGTNNRGSMGVPSNPPFPASCPRPVASMVNRWHGNVLRCFQTCQVQSAQVTFTK
jgi:hypothetical protein